MCACVSSSNSNSSSSSSIAMACNTTFDDFESALGSIPGKLSQREDWDPSKWAGANSPTCPICIQPLSGISGYGYTHDVEVLFETVGCGHCFHRDCLQSFIEGYVRHNEENERALRCPTCNRPISQSVLDTVFDESAEVFELPPNGGADGTE